MRVSEPSGVAGGRRSVPVRILHVDEDTSFAAATRQELEREWANLEVTSESDPTHTLDRLDTGAFDCVVCEYRSVGFDGLDLLGRVRECFPDLPFIFYTDHDGEDAAAAALAAGATDYVRKGHGSGPPAVLANRITTSMAVADVSNEYRSLFDAFGDGFLVHSTEDDGILGVNDRLCELLGYDREELRSLTIGDVSEGSSPYGGAHASAHIARAISEGPQRFDWVVRTRDGDSIPVEVTLSLVEDSAEPRVFALIRDVAELRETQRALAESERRHRLVAEGVDDAVFETDAEGRLTYVNEAWGTVVGGSSDEALGSPADALFVRTDDGHRNAFAALARGRRESTRHVIEHPDGHRRLEVFARAIYEDGAFAGTVGTLRDVSERYEYERELRAQNQRLKRAYERIDEGYYAVDRGWRVTYWNDRMADRTGRRASEVVGSVLWDVRPGLVGTEYDIYFREAMAAQRAVSFEAHAPDRDAWEEIRVYGSDGGLSVYTRDITERKARERELARTQDLLDQAQQMARVGGWEYDVREGETLMTVQTRRLFGLSSDEDPDPERVFEQFHREDRTALRKALTRAEREAVPFDLELRVPDAADADSVRWIRAICQPTTVAGETVLLRGTVQDVTVRHRHEEELKERERALEGERRFTDSLLDTLPDSFYTLDLSGALWRWNETFTERTGYADADLRGMSVLDLVGPDYRSDVEAAMAAVYDGETVAVEASLRRADGTEVPHELNGSPLYDANGVCIGLAGAARDISDRVARERELERQNERLEQFASIVSHDLRNPLTIASGGLDFARETGAQKDFDRIEEGLDRMERLIEDLLALAREGRDIDETVSVDLAAFAERAWDRLETDAGRLRVAGSLRFVADPHRLDQAFGNLFRNAVEHGGETVTVSVGPLEDGSGFYIADDGPGIPEDDVDRVFEYGYTDTVTGTGLGLAIVEAIVEAHGWTITATRSEAGGARFLVAGLERP